MSKLKTYIGRRSFFKLSALSGGGMFLGFNWLASCDFSKNDYKNIPDEWFKINGGLKRENGDHFRATLLSKGGSKDAIELFIDFKGSEPNIQPLLDRKGLN